MLVELLKLAGGEGAELCRRWVALLLSIPADERASAVEALERRVADLYPIHKVLSPGASRHVDGTEPDGAGPLLHITSEATQHAGYSEVVVRSYEAPPPGVKAKARAKTAKSGSRR